MSATDPASIRNVGLIAHSGAGKTSLAEAMLYVSGAVKRLGRTADGNTVMDYAPEEIRRQISLSTSVATAPWNGCSVNIIDTPGDANFVADALMSMNVMDGVVVLVSAVSGIKAQCEKVWEWATAHNLPRMIFVNKMDSEKASFETAFGQIDGVFHHRTVKLTIPIGAGPGFKGVVDLLTMKAYLYDRDGEGSFRETDIPDNLLRWAEKERREIVEAVAETDEGLLSRYLETDTLPDELLLPALRRAVMAGEIVPVLCGSATQNIVVRKTLNAIVQFFPSPLDRPDRTGVDADGNEILLPHDPHGPTVVQIFRTEADPYAGKLSYFRVWSGSVGGDTNLVNAGRNGAKEHLGTLLAVQGKKTETVRTLVTGDIGAVAKLKSAVTGDTLCDPKRPIVLPGETPPSPVLSMAVEAASRGDEDKLSTALARLMEEDPTLRLETNPETHEMLLSGMGQVHIEVTVNKLKEKFGLTVALHPPTVAYRETIRGSAKGHGRLKKQSGGHGQFADCQIELSPAPDGAVLEFVNAIVGGVIPKQYIPGVEKGIREAMAKGGLAGFPVTGVKATLFDGKFHDVDSSEMAFKAAAGQAFREAFENARPVLLEPMVEMEISVPEEFVGDVMSDLAQKRGRVLSLGIMGGHEVVKALAPLAEVLLYDMDLRQITGGRGEFTLSAAGYEEAPPPVAQKVIAAATARAK
ncbi:MAG: elongation factor G [Nitrospinae bacterium]|nr:elongation factor G [Nitrospinota bacterium]